MLIIRQHQDYTCLKIFFIFMATIGMLIRLRFRIQFHTTNE